MAGYVWDPKYIRQIISKNSGEVITADEWNNLLNLIINQGDYNTEQVLYLTEMFKVEGDFAEVKDELLKVLSQGPLAPLIGNIVVSYIPETEYVTLRCAPTSIGTELDNMYFLDAWTEPAAGLGTLPAYLGDRVFRDGTKFNIVFPETLKPTVSGTAARLMYGTPDHIPVYDVQTGQPPEEYKGGAEYTFTYKHHLGDASHCWTVSAADGAIAIANEAIAIANAAFPKTANRAFSSLKDACGFTDTLYSGSDAAVEQVITNAPPGSIITLFVDKGGSMPNFSTGIIDRVKANVAGAPTTLTTGLLIINTSLNVAAAPHKLTFVSNREVPLTFEAVAYFDNTLSDFAKPIVSTDLTTAMGTQAIRNIAAGTAVPTTTTCPNGCIYLQY